MQLYFVMLFANMDRLSDVNPCLVTEHAHLTSLAYISIADR